MVIRTLLLLLACGLLGQTTGCSPYYADPSPYYYDPYYYGYGIYDEPNVYWYRDRYYYREYRHVRPEVPSDEQQARPPRDDMPDRPGRPPGGDADEQARPPRRELSDTPARPSRDGSGRSGARGSRSQ